MKGRILTLLLVFALPVMARAESKQAVVHGRTVAVAIDVTDDSLSTCQTALDKMLEAKGWHDHILRSRDANKSVMVYSRRETADVASAKTVEVVLWKAIAHEGKTYTESWTYTINAPEMNRFLDTELPSVMEEFKTAPIQYTITIS